MFGLFKKKSPQEKLQEKYKKLIKRSYELSTTDRAQSDLLQAEAQQVLDEIDLIKKEQA